MFNRRRSRSTHDFSAYTGVNASNANFATANKPSENALAAASVIGLGGNSRTNSLQRSNSLQPQHRTASIQRSASLRHNSLSTGTLATRTVKKYVPSANGLVAMDVVVTDVPKRQPQKTSRPYSRNGSRSSSLQNRNSYQPPGGFANHSFQSFDHTNYKAVNRSSSLRHRISSSTLNSQVTQPSSNMNYNYHYSPNVAEDTILEDDGDVDYKQLIQSLNSELSEIDDERNKILQEKKLLESEYRRKLKESDELKLKKQQARLKELHESELQMKKEHKEAEERLLKLANAEAALEKLNSEPLEQPVTVTEEIEVTEVTASVPKEVAEELADNIQKAQEVPDGSYLPPSEGLGAPFTIDADAIPTVADMVLKEEDIPSISVRAEVSDKESIPENNSAAFPEKEGSPSSDYQEDIPSTKDTEVSSENTGSSQKLSMAKQIRLNRPELSSSPIHPNRANDFSSLEEQTVNSSDKPEANDISYVPPRSEKRPVVENPRPKSALKKHSSIQRQSQYSNGKHVENKKNSALDSSAAAKAYLSLTTAENTRMNAANANANSQSLSRSPSARKQISSQHHMTSLRPQGTGASNHRLSEPPARSLNGFGSGNIKDSYTSPDAKQRARDLYKIANSKKRFSTLDNGTELQRSSSFNKNKEGTVRKPGRLTLRDQVPSDPSKVQTTAAPAQNVQPQISKPPEYSSRFNDSDSENENTSFSNLNPPKLQSNFEDSPERTKKKHHSFSPFRSSSHQSPTTHTEAPPATETRYFSEQVESKPTQKKKKFGKLKKLFGLNNK
ncbi:Hypothetical protein PP7435_CHR3-0386 [Komagataella phaffii CBS 7435]|uniref:Uncharacterized protein n=2 Tax=Komagataella phaffii TaxID=460519 RepID=C4R5L9_KOMPG|nr:Hypothetical protein PAS_chr3_0802 [Komagataella phaffii GS115]AOA63470.1 GQ67_03907T0 [Komagataella phaffii]CAH2449349.1 Hypothetical protein BQ9382_C3-2100 [Komagataella phaffii CBS 7435]AOA68708.1 GQ68_03881T0 [Komagataella phaffii GS115]CAY70855.1 Hypothetical protein PAS_chr3_0802 [Komagataella phaffii GS115]CCA39352.1 Hypothetical protein PP7435_CHR3-0386 [Komagataella phaffii CBS 7435]